MKRQLPEASVTVLRLTALPAASVPLSVTVTPATPLSAPWRVPSLFASSHTLPESVAARSPKWLPAEPVAGRFVSVMAFGVPLLPLVPGFVLPSP